MKGLKATATPSLAFSLGVSENHPPLEKKKKENHPQYNYFPYCNCSSKTCQILGKSHSGNVILAFCMCLQNNPCSALRSPMAWPCGSSWPQMGVFLPKPLHSLFQYINVCWKPDSSLFVYISDYIFQLIPTTISSFRPTFTSQDSPQTGSSKGGGKLPHIMEMSRSGYRRPVWTKTLTISSNVSSLHSLFVG